MKVADEYWTKPHQDNEWSTLETWSLGRQDLMPWSIHAWLRKSRPHVSWCGDLETNPFHRPRSWIREKEYYFANI